MKAKTTSLCTTFYLLGYGTNLPIKFAVLRSPHPDEVMS
jgi:hypothetical protein